MHNVLPIISFPGFSAPHAFTTRWFPYNGKKTPFNLSTKDLNDGSHFAQYKLSYLKKILGIPEYQIYTAKQLHTNKVIDLVTENLMAAQIPIGDGIITQLNGAALAIKVADCAAIYLYDPKTRTIGLLHSGWQGTKENIIAAGINKMQTNYNCNPKDIQAAISPHISSNSYQVGPEFSLYFSEKYLVNNELGRCLDLQKCLVSQLTSCGILKLNIHLSDLCTFQNEDLFFSHRRNQTDERMMALIWLPQHST